MTEKITSGQEKQIRRFMEDGVAKVDLANLPKDSAQRVIAQGGVLQKRLAALIAELALAYFILLTDEEAHEWLRKFAGKNEADAKRIVLGYRRGAQEEEIPDEESCHIQVVSGATLKGTIPTIGKCVQDFRYLKDWDFPGPPTTDCLFSLVPTLLRDSTRKTVAEQRALLAQVRQRLELPANHLADFGAVTHLAGAALTHKAAGRDIFAGKIARTEVCGSGGSRLYLYWDQGQLHCDYWNFDEEGYGALGVLACGVEQALGS